MVYRISGGIFLLMLGVTMMGFGINSQFMGIVGLIAGVSLLAGF